MFFGEPLERLTHYPYPPLSLLWTAIGYRLAGDVRAMLLLAQLAAGAGLYVRARQVGARGGFALGAMALYLLHPRGMFVIEQAWTEPLLAAAFVWLLCALGRPRRASTDRATVPLALAFAAFFAAKQYAIILLPLFVAPSFFPRARAALVWGLGLAALTAVPFVVWDARAFADDVLWFQVHQPFRWSALSLAPVIAFLTGWKTSLLGPLAAALSMAIGWRHVPRDGFGLCLLASVTLLGWFLFAKQAFCNYYAFTGVVILCAAIAAPADRAPA
jgi:hypothetical protein